MTTMRRPEREVGALLREWRERRRLSQLDLAGRAEVSARHVSTVETGRARPTSAMILRLSEQLDVPLRDRNALLLAGGYAPAYPEHGLAEPPMSAVSAAITAVLGAHEPYPAVVVDRHWDLVAGNDAVALLTDGCAPDLLEPPANVLRLSLHPDGMAPRIANLGQWRAHLLDRLERQAAHVGDPVLRDLLAELRGYPGDGAPGPEGARGVGGARRPDTDGILVPLRFRTGGGELALFSTTTVFGTPLDVTVSELAIEAFYPVDEDAARRLRALARAGAGPGAGGPDGAGPDGAGQNTV